MHRTRCLIAALSAGRVTEFFRTLSLRSLAVLVCASRRNPRSKIQRSENKSGVAGATKALEVVLLPISKVPDRPKCSTF